MKKYTLLEALNMLKQDHDLVFKIVQEEALCNQMISSNVIGNVMVSCQGCQGRTNCPLQFKDMWTLKQKPVSFIEALNKALEGNKKLKNVAWVDKPVTLEHVFNLFAQKCESGEKGRRCVKSWIIGEWIVEENEEETTSTDKTKFIEINYKDLRDKERHTKYFSTQGEYEEWHEENWNDVVING
jgi:hypothetical protein